MLESCDLWGRADPAPQADQSGSHIKTFLPKMFRDLLFYHSHALGDLWRTVSSFLCNFFSG